MIPWKIFQMTAVDKTLLLAYHRYLQFRRNRDILRRSETFITTCQACPKVHINSIIVDKLDIAV